MGTEVKGATLTLTGKDSEGNAIVFADGVYTLHEDAAPNGYKVASEVTFEIENGKLV